MISEHAVLADGLDRPLHAVDVVPAGLLQVPAVIRHKLHLYAVLKKNCQQCKSRSFIGPPVLLSCGLAVRWCRRCRASCCTCRQPHSSTLPRWCLAWARWSFKSFLSFHLQKTSWSKSHLNSVSSLVIISSLARLVRSLPPVQ